MRPPWPTADACRDDASARRARRRHRYRELAAAARVTFGCDRENVRSISRGDRSSRSAGPHSMRTVCVARGATRRQGRSPRCRQAERRSTTTQSTPGGQRPPKPRNCSPPVVRSCLGVDTVAGSRHWRRSNADGRVQRDRRQMRSLNRRPHNGRDVVPHASRMLGNQRKPGRSRNPAVASRRTGRFIGSRPEVRGAASARRRSRTRCRCPAELDAWIQSGSTARGGVDGGRRHDDGRRESNDTTTPCRVVNRSTAVTAPGGHCAAAALMTRGSTHGKVTGARLRGARRWHFGMK